MRSLMKSLPSHVTETDNILQSSANHTAKHSMIMIVITTPNGDLGWQDLSRVHDVERVKDLLDSPHPFYTDIALRISECTSLH